MSKKKNPFSIVERPPTNLDYALAYAALPDPWYVFPVWSVDKEGRCRCGRPNSDKGHSAGKHPIARLCPQGYLDASIDPEVLRHWWESDPEAGIGFALAVSGKLALDVDRRYNGQEAIAKLEEQHGKFHSDCVNITQDRGEHRIFNIEAADRNLTFPASIGRGLDLKHHGYICLPPTMGPLGPYHWEEGHSPLSQSNPAVPSRLPDYIRSLSSVAYAVPERDGVLVATTQTFEDLRSALKYIDADDYHNWIMVGLCVRAYGESGYNVWAEWSKRSEKFNPVEQRRKWEEDLQTPRAITYRTLFRMAMDAGWENVSAPLPKKEPTEDPHTPQLLMATRAEFPAMDLKLPEFLIPEWLPRGAITLFSGHGGVGKSTLMLQLCARLASGAAELLGQDLPNTGPLRVVYLSGEDMLSIIDQRLEKMLQSIPELDEHAVNTNILFGDASVLAVPLLVSFDMRSSKPQLSAAYKQLKVRIEDFQPDLIVVDNNSIFFGGEEINRTQVHAYLHSLLQLCPTAAIVALHHMDKASLSREDGEGWSGSTQWHNAARARWTLSEVDGALTLYLRKSNYGMAGWRGEIFFDPKTRVHILGVFAHVSISDEQSIRHIQKITEQAETEVVRRNTKAELDLAESQRRLLERLRRLEPNYPSPFLLYTGMGGRREHYQAVMVDMIASGAILEHVVTPEIRIQGNIPPRQATYLSAPPLNDGLNPGNLQAFRE